jgi:hypothetical protein
MVPDTAALVDRHCCPALKNLSRVGLLQFSEVFLSAVNRHWIELFLFMLLLGVPFELD